MSPGPSCWRVVPGRTPASCRPCVYSIMAPARLPARMVVAEDFQAGVKIEVTGSGRKGPSAHQAVAAGLGHEEGGLAGAGLDLLAQAVDVGLERVGGDACVVAPDLVQQHFARDR